MNFRFIHSTKTGGTSVVKGLRTKYPDIPHTHRPLPSKKVLQKLGIIYTFATVCHPYEREIDKYNYFERINKKYTPDEYFNQLKKGYKIPGIKALFTAPQIIHLKNKTTEVDDIIRRETYDQDYDRILNGVLQINTPVLHANKTKTKIITELTKEQRSIVDTVFKVDFDYLGYEHY